MLDTSKFRENLKNVPHSQNAEKNQNLRALKTTSNSVFSREKEQKTPSSTILILEKKRAKKAWFRYLLNKKMLLGSVLKAFFQPYLHFLLPYLMKNK